LTLRDRLAIRFILKTTRVAPDFVKILICFFGLALMTDAVFGQSQLAHAAEEIQKPILAITNAASVGPGTIAYNSNGRYLAVADDTVIRIYELRAGDRLAVALVRTLTGHDGRILGLGFSGTNTLVSVSADQAVKIWEIETGKLLHTAQLQVGKQLCFAIAPGRARAADTSFGHVRLWNFRTGEVLTNFEPGDSWASVLAFTPDEKSLVIGTEKGVLRVMDVATWTVTRTIDLDSPIRSLAASAEHIVVGYSDGTVAILNFGDQPSVPEIKKQKGAINALAFSPKGEQFASASADHSVKIWDVATLKPICSLEGHGAAVLAVAFSPDGKGMASVDSSGVVNFWTAPRR
jgi:WD40 repeat protein